MSGGSLRSASTLVNAVEPEHRLAGRHPADYANGGGLLEQGHMSSLRGNIPTIAACSVMSAQAKKDFRAGQASDHHESLVL